MTEHEWLTCRTTPTAMVRHLRHKLSARKRDLVAAACCRLVWEHLTQPGTRAAIEQLELHADGILTEGDRRALPPGTEPNQFHPIWESNVGQLREQELAATNAVRAAVSGRLTGLSRCLEWLLLGFAAAAQEGERQAVLNRMRSRVCDLLREIVGNPFRPWKVVPEFLGGGVIRPDGRTARLSRTAFDLAESIHADQAFDRLPVLADALEESGVTDPDLLAHCRDGAGHVRGCWALDVVRGKA